MRRIGITSSKIAQGNLCKYNAFVVGISVLFSIIIFLVCEFCVLAMVLAASLIARGLMHKNAIGPWFKIMTISSAAIGSIVFVLLIWAIVKNIRFNANEI